MINVPFSRTKFVVYLFETQLCSCYGATETTAPVTNNLPGEGWHREGSVGRSGNGALNELLLGADPDSSGVGEIVCGSRNVFMGYHRDWRKTAEAFTEDDWYRTGDQVRGIVHCTVQELIVMVFFVIPGARYSACTIPTWPLWGGGDP